MSGRERHLTNQLVIRLDDVLLARVQADAEANGRTVAQTVRHHLGQSLRKRTEPEAPMFSISCNGVPSGQRWRTRDDAEKWMAKFHADCDAPHTIGA